MADWRRRTPHLLPRERQIWQRFAANPPFPIDDATFDLHLGEGMPVDPSWPPAIQAMARRLTQKRVDVVVRSGGETWILEIKVRAGMSALGQLLGYGLLYVAQFNPMRPPQLAVVAEAIQPDMAGVFAQYGIRVFLVQR